MFRILLTIMVLLDPALARYSQRSLSSADDAEEDEQGVVPYEINPSPQLHPLEDEHVIDSGDSFSIRCSGRRPVEWIPPRDESMPNGSSPISERTTTVEEVIEGESPRPFLSHLEVTDLHYLDTGYYYCRYKDSGGDGNVWSNSPNENVTSTYLYVRDNISLFDAVSLFSWVNVPQYQETVIPCRPTSPEVEMTFKQDSQDITQILEERLLRYEPHRGLVVTFGTMAFHTGMLQCTAKKDDQKQEFTAILQFQPDPEVVPTPFIEKPHADTIFVGGNITLACQLPIELSMPHIELEWQFPQPDIKEHLRSGRIVVEEQRRERIGRGSDLSIRYPSSTLMIIKLVRVDPIVMEDVGEYFCKAVVLGTGKASSAHRYDLNKILLDANQPYIGKPNFYGDPDITVSKQGDTVTWVFHLQANPNPEFTWYHPTGLEIDYKTLEKYEMDVDPKKDKVKLVINNVDLRDTGQYRFMVEVKDSSTGVVSSDDILLTLKFVRSPHVKLDVATASAGGGAGGHNGSLFVAEEFYELDCVVEGFPIDTDSLRWEFARCDNSYEECGEPTAVKPDTFKPTDGIMQGDQHYKYTSTFWRQANESGIFTCHVCSKYEPIQKTPVVCNQSSLSFFVTDFHTGFDIIGPSNLNQLVERDFVALKCAASIYEYKAPSWHKQSSAGQWEKVVATNTKTQFSHVATLRFNEIRMRDAGQYRCTASPLNLTRSAAVKQLQVTVLEIVPPVKEPQNNMNGSKVHVDTSSKLSLNCRASGRPTPVVVWSKDDTVVTPEEIGNSTTMELLEEGQVLDIRFAVVKNSGLYRCTATNRGGSFSAELEVNVRAQAVAPKGLVAGVVLGLVVLCIICAVLLWKVKIYNRKYKELTQAELDMFVAGDPQSINPDLGVDDQADLLPYNREFEFSRDKLKLGKQLGSGAFGRVVKAQAFGIVVWERSTTVAVKMVKPHADITYIRALMAELKIMMHLGKHLNIVNLLGACTTGLGKRELLVIVEYCRFGNIQKYLLLHRSNFINQIDPDTAEINFQIGADIVLGVHGNDLARAREEDEMSAAYTGRHLSVGSMTTDGLTSAAAGVRGQQQQRQSYVQMAAAATTSLEQQKPPQQEEEDQQCGGGGGGGASATAEQPQRRPPSVRYIVDPATHRAARVASKQLSVQSDYNDGLDQIVLTDMTTVPVDDSSNGGGGGGSQEAAKYKRSLSTIQGPGWRSNVRGDYDMHTVRPISTKDLVCWAYQVTRGMEYLASKKVMHGDLACRNILLAADNVVKICDFGLAKDIYKTNNYRKKTDGPLPVKWMAIESLRDRVFSTQSDVWSFGIVLWEMFSLGKTPYPGIEAGEHYHMLLDGYRMEKPEYCPRVIYRIMTDCWQAEPCQRPNFQELMDTLGDLLGDGERDHYLDLSKQLLGKRHVTAVENRDYLSMFSSPDYGQQMTPRSNGDIMEEEEGYLVPTLPLKDQPPEEEEDGYLLPKTQKLSIVDDSGYLMPNSSLDSDEKKSMLPNRDNGNVVVAATVK